MLPLHTRNRYSGIVETPCRHGVSLVDAVRSQHNHEDGGFFGERPPESRRHELMGRHTIATEYFIIMIIITLHHVHRHEP